MSTMTGAEYMGECQGCSLQAEYEVYCDWCKNDISHCDTCEGVTHVSFFMNTDVLCSACEKQIYTDFCKNNAYGDNAKFVSAGYTRYRVVTERKHKE